MKELTLAIPNFNGGKYLAKTLASIVQQDAHVRWYLQDGLSTDDSLAIAREWHRDSDCIVQEKDMGQTDALNKAFVKMSGDIIGFINADDCLRPGAARHVLDLFDDPAIELVVGGIRYVDGNGQPLRDHFGQISSLEEMLNLFDVWFQERQWVQPEVFFRRSLWERVGFFDTSYQYAFDYDFWVRCLRKRARIRATPRLLAEFRIHPAQKSSQAAEAGRELFQIAYKHVCESREITMRYRWVMKARLEYAINQGILTRTESTTRRFVRDLATHPSWFLGHECRDRIRTSIRNRFR